MTDADADVSTPLPPAPERNVRLTLEYDGRAYCGWETQKNGTAIQEVLERAIFEITREHREVFGSGRTDAGVHARGQVASFRSAKDITMRKLRLGLNAVLPEDIAVVAAAVVPDAFHARFSAVSKTYRYSILNARSRHPLERHRVFHFPQALDVASMQRAAAALVGTHDFRAFAKEAHRRKNCVRTMIEARVESDGVRVDVVLRGTGFLYNMVRIVTGTLIEIGIGRRPESTFAQALATGKRVDAGFTVPPDGLCLESVEYPAELAPIGDVADG